MKKIIFRRYVLKALEGSASDTKKLGALHGALRRFRPFIDRVAVALYDAKTRTAKTFLASGPGFSPLAHYESSLDDARSLLKIIRTKKARVVNDMAIFRRGKGERARKLRREGFKSGYAFPMVFDGRVAGFVFFNSRSKNSFDEKSLPLLDVFGHLISSVAGARLRSARVMLAALKTANDMVHFRDFETGNHLQRMARYAGLIARDLARTGLYDFDDERIQMIETFAPLHDVGKLGIPDDVLLKPGPLSPDEKKNMRTHSSRGRRIVDAILKNFGPRSFGRASVLRQIVESHHEALDGSGYPRGLKGKQISIEARIVSVADVFDALTSARPYKKSWSNDRAFRFLAELGKTKLDGDCVRALTRRRKSVEKIQKQFRDKFRNDVSSLN